MSSRSKGKRPDGLIQVSITIEGKRRYFYGRNRQEARHKAQEAKYASRHEEQVIQPLTLSEWVSQYLATYRTGINRAYLINDNVPYNRLVERLGDKLVSDITEADLQAALNEVTGMSFSTCRNYRQVIRRIFRKAWRNKLIADDPSADIKMPAYTKGTHRALEQWEIQTILANWDAPNQWAGLWIMIMLLCGLRRGEMMALEWEHIDLDTRTLKVCQVAVIESNQTTIEPRAKTEAGIRVVPICEPLYNALVSIPKIKRTGFVCLSSKGKQLSETAVSRGIEKSLSVWSSLCGRTLSLRTHDLRHTYATMLYESGMDVKVAQYLLGHADMRMTLQLYTHLSNRHKNESQSILMDYMNNLSTTAKAP